MVENESNVCSTSSQAYAADQSSCAAVYTRQLPFPLCFSYKITYETFFFVFYLYWLCIVLGYSILISRNFLVRPQDIKLFTKLNNNNKRIYKTK